MPINCRFHTHSFWIVDVWAEDEINVPIALSAFRDKKGCVGFGAYFKMSLLEIFFKNSDETHERYRSVNDQGPEDLEKMFVYS